MFVETINRLEAKSPMDVFVGTMTTDFGLSRVEAYALYEWNYKFMQKLNGISRKPGQIIKAAIAFEEPPGKPVRECKLVNVKLTLDDVSDLEVLRRHGVSELRLTKILRLCCEALDQGGLLTQEDLALLLNSDRTTISRDIQYLRAQGIEVPTRGYMGDIGRATSHKRKAVDMYLNGFELTEVARRLYHAPTSIDRYLNDFVRVMILSEGGYSKETIRYTVGISERLAEEYLTLVKEYKEKGSQRLQELRERFKYDLKKTVGGA